MKNIMKLLALLISVTLVTVGCNTTDSGQEGVGSLQLQMQVNSENMPAKQFLASQEHEDFAINEVKLFIEEMELESVENDSLDFEIENFIVNLPLDGSPLTLTEQQIPAGVYDEFELEIEKPDYEDVEVNDPDFRDETGSYSLVVKGLFEGSEFTFRSTEDFEIDVDLEPALVIGESESSVLTISVDVNSWFRGSNGEVLDPKDPVNTEQINENIETSFEGFEDSFDDDDDDDDDE